MPAAPEGRVWYSTIWGTEEPQLYRADLATGAIERMSQADQHDHVRREFDVSDNGIAVYETQGSNDKLYTTTANGVPFDAIESGYGVEVDVAADGSHVFYAMLDYDDAGTVDVYALDVATQGRTKLLTYTTRSVPDPRIIASPDGRSAAVQEQGGRDSDLLLYVSLDAPDSPRVVVAPESGFGVHVEWIPGDTRMIWQQWPGDSYNVPAELYVDDPADDVPPERIAGNVRRFAVSADGSTVAYVTWDGLLYAASTDELASPRLLDTAPPADEWAITLSDDGEWLELDAYGEFSTLSLVRTDGAGVLTRVGPPGWWIGDRDWYDDRLLFVVDGYETAAVWLADANAPEAAVQLADEASRARFSEDGGAIVLQLLVPQDSAEPDLVWIRPDSPDVQTPLHFAGQDYLGEWRVAPL